MKIKVYDAMMGSGKTTRLIQEISQLPKDAKIIYITPLLSECHRIAGTSYDPDDEFKRPLVISTDVDGIEEYVYDSKHPLSSRRFRHPTHAEGSKLETLLFQVKNGCNIVATHALLRSITPKVIAAIKEKGYLLVLDEVLTVYEHFGGLDTKEAVQLLENGIISIQEDGLTLTFHKDKFGETANTRYQEIADLCEMKQLLMVDGKVVMWEFPLVALETFKEIRIATYLFSGSQMGSYLDIHNVPYEHIRFGYKPSQVKHLIKIEEDEKLNQVGEKRASLSHECLVNKKKYNEQLRKNLSVFFRNKHGTKVHQRLWTTYKSAAAHMSAGRFAKSWLACGTKATNDWKDTSHVAYIVNLHANPTIMKLLSIKGSEMDQDLFALSEMVQFIWRSRIRQGQEIVLYVPSKRMRTLLVDWLDDKFEAGTKEKLDNESPPDYSEDDLKFIDFEGEQNGN